jgi:hypothetical protein
MFEKLLPTCIGTKLNFWAEFLQNIFCSSRLKSALQKYISTCIGRKVKFCTPFFAKFFYFLRFEQEKLRLAHKTGEIFCEKTLLIYFGSKIKFWAKVFENIFLLTTARNLTFAQYFSKNIFLFE